MSDYQQRKRAPRWVRVMMCLGAIMLMLAAAIYQRLTGPTYPLRGQFDLGETAYEYRLITSAYSTHDTLVAVSDPGEGVTGDLNYRRYPTDDVFTAVPMQRLGDQFGARLPAQPPAGKLEYYMVLRSDRQEVRIPVAAEGNVIIRFKGHVPVYVLLPHVFMMFCAILIGLRTAFAAVFDPAGMRMLAWTTLVLMTTGGLILGPIVQNHAFGAYWTGFPFGYDLTDNKTLIMWVVWLAACLIIGAKPVRREGFGRLAVVGAAVVMMIVYLIPHSLRGSELDYGQLEQGIPAEEAIGVGGEE